ncbi:MAG: hypothetical protein GX230_08785 [Lentisphaerae bacterium]|jgi:hypothetical protein|nr:hypothetical protein [Lentisphaerota bacterium]
MGSKVRFSKAGLVLALGCTILLFTTTGCISAASRTCCAHTAQQALLAADAALSSYDALRTVASDSLYNQGYMRVVVSPEPDAVDFTNVADADMSTLLDLRSSTCRQVKLAAEQLQLACGAQSKTEAVQSYAAIVEALRGFAKDPAANAEFKKMAAALPEGVTATWQSRRMEQTRSALAAATIELATLWKKERATWEEYIDDAYISGYASGILSLRLDSFDEKELAKIVKDPYDLPVKAGLYKMTKYFDALQSAGKVKAKLRTTTEVFDTLHLAPICK